MKMKYCPECKRLIYPKRPPLGVIPVYLTKGEIGSTELDEFFEALDKALEGLPHRDKVGVDYVPYGEEIEYP